MTTEIQARVKEEAEKKAVTVQPGENNLKHFIFGNSTFHIFLIRWFIR